MENTPLFSEICALYLSNEDISNVMCVRLRVRDPIDGEILKNAEETAAVRYPYFCVELKKQGKDYVFEKNDRHVVVINSEKGVELNSEESNYHLFSVSWYENRLFLYMSHALTDGTGMYRFLQTLLYYYISEYYNKKLNCPGVWLVTDPIEEEELVDHARHMEKVPVEEGGELSPGLNVVKKAELKNDTEKTVHSIVISESEFMKFNFQNEGSPATMISLLLARAFADIFPDASEKIRISVCINLRKGMDTPRAHHGNVGGIWLEYLDRIRDWPLEKQMIAFRGKLIAESRQEKLLMAVSNSIRGTERLLAMENDDERAAASKDAVEGFRDLQTATVSYVGKANFGDIEQYIEEFHMWAPAVFENVLLELSAINGRMFIDFIQNFSDRRFFDAFLRQLSQNGIAYQSQSTHRLEIPKTRLPWIRG